MHTIGSSSSGGTIFVCLLLWTILTHYGGEASVWSYLTGATEDFQVQENGSDNSYDNDNDELVSPIVNREIKVSVKAPWPSSSEHSVLCEAFAFLQGNHAFLDALTKNHGKGHLVSYERSTKYALELAREVAGLDDDDDDEAIATTNGLRLLKVALTMRAMSPTCELHRSLAHDKYEDLVEFLEAFAVIPTGDGDEIIIQISSDLPTSTIDLPMLSKAERNALLLPNEVIRQGIKTITVDDDEIENDEDELCETFVILYANLGGISFATFYRSLVENEIPVVVRHMGSIEEDQAETVLQGYGVRLDIRNVEYKVFDDKKSSIVDDSSIQDLMINLTQLGTNNGDDDDDVDVGGTCFSGEQDGVEVNNRMRTGEELATHFLAGVNLTALGLSNDNDGDCNDENSAYKLQRQLWELHRRFEKHSQLIPPAWQRRRLSIQTATVIAHSRHPLITLQDLSQNLPSMASTLVHVKIPEDIEKVGESMEIHLQKLISISGGGLWINGRSVNIERPSFNVFELIKLLKDESDVIQRLESRLKPMFPSGDALVILERIQDAVIEGDSFFANNRNMNDAMYEHDESSSESSNSNSKGQYRIDLATGEVGSVIYMNDLENDMSYSHWSDSVKNMVMAMQYGMPPSVRRNLFTILIVVDPLEDENDNVNFGQALIHQLAQQEFPVRLAMVVVSQTDVDDCVQYYRDGKICPVPEDYWLDRDDPPSVNELKEIKLTTRDIHRLYAFMRQKFADNSDVLIPYQLYLGSSLRQNPPSNRDFYSLYDLFNTHNEILLGLKIVLTKISLEEIAESLQENEQDSKLSYGKTVLFALDKGIKVGMSFINGRPLPTNEEEAEKLQKIFMEEQKLVFKMIKEKEITDSKPRNFYYKLIKGKKKDVFPRLHPLLTSSKSATSFADIAHNFGIYSLLTPQSMINASPLDSDAILLFEAVLQLDTSKGLRFALNFLKAMDVLPNSFGEISIAAKYRIIPSTLNAASTNLCKLLNSELGFGKIEEILERLISNSDASVDDYATLNDTSQCNDLPYLREELPSKNFITANGRVYNIEDLFLSFSDVELLTSMSLDSSKIVTAMLKPYVDDAAAFDAIGKTTAFLLEENNLRGNRSGPEGKIASTEKSEKIESNPLRFSWNREVKGVRSLKTKVFAIVDPTTETAQRLSPLLLIIRDELELYLDLILAPRMELNGDSDIPISSYYRFVANPSVYQTTGGSVGSPIAHFSNLPTDQILTLRMDVPESWNVQQTLAIQDTDNLRCDLQSGCGDYSQTGIEMHRQIHLTNIEYGLEHLLFFGQCYETNNSPPNGLQLVLSKQKSKPSSESAREALPVEIEVDGSIRMEDLSVKSFVKDHYSDTLVMKTVGYWQLRANPGVWDLKINDNSRGAEIFQIVEGKIKRGSVRVSSNSINSNKKQLVIDDFVGRGRGDLLLVKRKPGYEKASLFYEERKNVSQDDDVVHVFSLATGHQYERFLKIMMLSVTKRTSAKVKFWLFENFLSPTFKASSMAMAKRIGCEVEFVTYKWPEWLRGQSEKQRIIWGYKILFLDVLFPLNVKKIIYVDSDQVVRGDLKELWNMDLNGAPYGYTPMCSSNEATLGFQFWRHGFWESHLRGKPYHISALYVVDLEKFRKDRVGDILRAQYQSLSADPNSLSNLDQDLPNYVQHQVPIFSLPQEWLWCESWCSNETKAEAKTIDLCNNPLHKEPKISMAKRIISGDLFAESWIELDAEVEKYEIEYIVEA